MASKAATSNGITLKGSVDIVTEFFGYSINSILYQRGVYPPDQFTPLPKYGLTMLVTNDTALQEYLGNVTKMIRNYLMVHALQKVVVVVTGVTTGENLERWAFDIEADKEVTEDGGGPVHEKPMKEITKEIQAIIRQITASVTFLPMLDEPCAFEVLLYTDKDAKAPETMAETDAKFIANSEDMRLRSFSTSVHEVSSMVSYKVDDD